MSKEEVDKNFDFERERQPYANAFYIARGYKIDRIKGKRNKDFDVILTKDGSIKTVEEKFLRKDLDTIYVEIVQDTKTKVPGWIEYTKATYLLYIMPSRTLLCCMGKLKKFIRLFGQAYPDAISTKGWGRTLNKVIPIDDILINSIGVEYSLEHKRLDYKGL